MRYGMAILAAVISYTTGVVSIQAQDGVLPRECIASAMKLKLPSGFYCPAPYVEMERDDEDEIFHRAWYCRETDHSLGLVREGGCSGSAGRAMFPGWSVPDPVQPVKLASSYKETVLRLFEDFLRMKRDGVFASGQLVTMFEKGQILLPSDIRGDNPPGGFFARPPGSTWLKEVERLQDETNIQDGFDDECFDIPKNLVELDVVCGHDLTFLYSGALDYDRRPQYLENTINQFWLAKICHEHSEACALPLR